MIIWCEAYSNYVHQSETKWWERTRLVNYDPKEKGGFLLMRRW
jgi:hypothetical protein